jgi:hypothetical protein
LAFVYYQQDSDPLALKQKELIYIFVAKYIRPVGLPLKGLSHRKNKVPRFQVAVGLRDIRIQPIGHRPVKEAVESKE